MPTGTNQGGNKKTMNEIGQLIRNRTGFDPGKMVSLPTNLSPEMRRAAMQVPNPPRQDLDALWCRLIDGWEHPEKYEEKSND